jgi:beta-lactamase superfamily II metal-dependent hydrolase
MTMGGDGAISTGNPAAADREEPFFVVEMLPAGPGDALWIEYGTRDDLHRVLIDGGTYDTDEVIKARLAKTKEKTPHFDLIVITHVDDDHIGGMLRLLIDKRVRLTTDDLWLNAWDQLPGTRPHPRLGVAGAEFFTLLLRRRRIAPNRAFNGEAAAALADRPLTPVRLAGGMQLTMLSPGIAELDSLKTVWQKELAERKLDGNGWDEGAIVNWMHEEHPPKIDKEYWLLGGRQKRIGKVGNEDELRNAAESEFTEDGSPTNGSSIAVLAEFAGRACVLAGDAYPSVLAASLVRLRQERGERGERLEITAMKVPHHGSRANVSIELVRDLGCRRFLVSTDGSGRQRHPDTEGIARIVAYSPHPVELYFNYHSPRTDPWGDETLATAGGYQPFYGTGGSISVDL